MTKDTTYILFYLVTNIFATYVIKLFMNAFFSQEGVNKRREFLSYVGLYVVPTILYLTFDIPVLNLISTTLFLILIMMNYQSSIKKRILDLVLLEIIIVIVESITVLICNVANFNMVEASQNDSLIAQVIVPLIQFVVASLMVKIKSFRRGNEIPVQYWIAIIAVPCMSAYLLIMVFTSGAFSKMHLLLASLFVMMINVFIFGLYDRQIRIYEEEKRAQTLALQNDMLSKQVQMIQTSNEMARSMRHDWKNHIHIIQDMIAKENYEQLSQYTEKMEKESGLLLNRAQSGNPVLDSILNFKLYEAMQAGVKADIELSVPENLKVDNFELNVVLSNLLDNAVTAASQSKDNAYMSIRIAWQQNRLIIAIDNTYSGQILQSQNKLMTTKEDSKHHGIGLDNVRHVLEKNNGNLKLEYDDERFHSMAIWNMD